MSLPADILSYFGLALAVVWTVYMTVQAVHTARTGRFPYWRRKPNGQTWPPVRSEKPVQFWIVWAAMADPYFLFTAVVLLGLGLTILQR